jgi:hypothetical protein
MEIIRKQNNKVSPVYNAEDLNDRIDCVQKNICGLKQLFYEFTERYYSDRDDDKRRSRERGF